MTREFGKQTVASQKKDAADGTETYRVNRSLSDKRDAGRRTKLGISYMSGDR